MTHISNKNKISGLVITLNEELNIEKLVQNIDFVDEIIVVDSFSTDRTIEILSKFPQIKVVQNKFDNYAQQRNLALTFANNPWILFLDADERITPELKKEILQVVQNPNAKDLYYVYRKFMFKNKAIRFSGTQTDKNFRLFKKENIFYKKDLLVHETLETKGKTIGTLKNKLVHYSYTNYQEYKQKMISYGRLKAKGLYNKGKQAFFYDYIKPIYNFLYAYIIRLGFLDGKKGIIICYLKSLSVWVRYRELKKLHSKK